MIFRSLMHFLNNKKKYLEYYYQLYSLQSQIHGRNTLKQQPSQKYNCTTDYFITMRFSAALLLAVSATAGAFFQTSAPLRTSRQQTALFAKPKIFIDGEAGTTGLQVRGRIQKRDDLEVISPPSDLRKDEATRKKLINEADAVILCKFGVMGTGIAKFEVHSIFLISSLFSHYFQK